MNTDRFRFLRRAMLGNALLSALCGLVLTVASTWIAPSLGLVSSLPLVGIGVGLLLFAARLAVLARREVIPTGETMAIVVADLLWVVFSVDLLAGGDLTMTPTGRWLVILTAADVLVLGLMQAWGLWSARLSTPTNWTPTTGG